MLYDEYLTTPSGRHDLTPFTNATVDTAGNLAHKTRSTLTRMGAGTVIAGPLGFMVGGAFKKGKTVDTRELFLMVEGGNWANTSNCDPEKEGQKAREFAQKVSLAARNVERVKAERVAKVAELQERLTALEADRSSIEQARAARRALGDAPTASVTGEQS